MMTMRDNRILSVMSGLASASAVLLLCSTAVATGIPTQKPLYYSGLLVDTGGKPQASVDAITIELWDTETGGTKPACTTTILKPTLTQGRFREALSTDCVAAIQLIPDLWVQVQVTLPGKTVPTSLGRTKIGAVPFTVEPKDSKKWNDAYGWGDHAKEGYLKNAKLATTLNDYLKKADLAQSETDPVFKASAAGGITKTNISSWNTGASQASTAHGWGDHASAGYLKSYTETDPVFAKSTAYGISSTNTSNWNTAYGRGNHASAGYLKSYTEADPQVGSISTGYVPRWNGSSLVTGGIYDDGAGRIGIGTTKPTSPLQIEAYSTTGDEYISIVRPSGENWPRTGRINFKVPIVGGSTPMTQAYIESGRAWQQLTQDESRFVIGMRKDNGQMVETFNMHRGFVMGANDPRSGAVLDDNDVITES